MAENVAEIANAKPRVSYPVIVEGKYDKIRIRSFFDCDVIVLDGYSFFNDDGKKAFLKKISEKSSVIVLTDPDGAGMFIRTHLRDIIPKDRIIDVYVKPVKGVEKRKEHSSADGIMGVEGAGKEELMKALGPYTDGADGRKDGGITPSLLYSLGLSGRPFSAERRRKVCEKMGLPELSSSNFADALNILSDSAEITAVCGELFGV